MFYCCRIQVLWAVLGDWQTWPVFSLSPQLKMQWAADTSVYSKLCCWLVLGWSSIMVWSDINFYSTLFREPQQGTHLIYLKNSPSLPIFEIRSQELAGCMDFAGIMVFCGSQLTASTKIGKVNTYQRGLSDFYWTWLLIQNLNGPNVFWSPLVHICLSHCRHRGRGSGLGIGYLARKGMARMGKLWKLEASADVIGDNSGENWHRAEHLRRA